MNVYDQVPSYFTDSYIAHIHCIMLIESTNLDAVHEDFILKLVGKFGLNDLKACGLIEPLDTVNGKQMYKIN